MAISCSKFNDALFRRVPDFDKELAKDRFPHDYTYNGLYKSSTWPSFTGTEHTWDKVHVTVPNDDGCWEEMDADSCATRICDPTRLYTGWGSTRSTYTKYHRDYQSPVFCYDQLRHVEEAVQQLQAIVEGHKALPDEIISNFLRLQAVRTADKIWIAGNALASVTVSASTFRRNCTEIVLGSAGNLPTSKLTMQYLNHYAPTLMYKGYHKGRFAPDAKFEAMTDIQTLQDLGNGNPALTQMYNAADFVKGGKFFAYGVMMGIGNFLFKPDPTPLRFQHMGSGVLRRIFPFENVATTIGKKPEFDEAYENAEYQISHVYNRAAREIFVGDTSPVNPEMKFLSRDLMGKWSWKSPDYFRATDPNTGTVCEYQNDKKNKGYFLGEFELGVKTVYPEIEMVILHKREPQGVGDSPRCAATPSIVYQDLTPYNSLCEES